MKKLRVAAFALVLVTFSVVSGVAQDDQWRFWGGDAGSTRYSPLDQINADNFQDLQIAWVWRGDNFGPRVDHILRAVPLYVNGRLYTHAGSRRTVVAIDPATGETLWTFREPHTPRWERSVRANWGKGVAYAEIGGRGVIYMTSPAYFLHALDAETGQPLRGFGKPIAVPGFGEYGTVDMLAYQETAQPFDPYHGPAPEVGHITTSQPPMVVNGVIIVGSALDGGGTSTTRMENIRGDILAFDARTGEFKWRFRTIPQPGEYGHETWENDAWQWLGNTAAWAPISADQELGIVYLATETPTNDAFAGFYPGDNLFANSVLALDIQTGERLWHFQTVRRDVWDYDLPWAPMLVDLNVNGERVPALVQITKYANAFTFNRITGEPIFPIRDVPVPQSQVPGERSAPTQPLPLLPKAWEMQGMTEADVVEFTPELRAMALEALKEFKFGPLFNPMLHLGNPEGYRGSLVCPSFTGGTNVSGGAAIDAETGIMYVASRNYCDTGVVVPASLFDDGSPQQQGSRVTGRTVVDWVWGSGAHRGNPNFIPGTPIPTYKPPYGRITAIDMNTGETLWWIPNGDTPEQIAKHPLLAGVDLPNTGQHTQAHPLVTRSLLVYGEGRGGTPRLHAVDKFTGDRIATVDLPAASSMVPVAYMHEGRQYIVVPVADSNHPGSLVALRLP
jgi:glucose dehydrogenase